MRFILTALLISTSVLFSGCHHKSRAAKRTTRKFVKIDRLENGGSAYYDGSNWWYQHIRIDSDGANYLPDGNTWVSSTRSPVDFRLSINTKDSAVEEVEVTNDGKPEGDILSAEEASELESQVNDMVNEGNPNDQDTSMNSDTESSTSDSDSGDSGSGDSGGGDSGGGDGGGGDGGD